jgi:hypothetical protein
VLLAAADNLVADNYVCIPFLGPIKFFSNQLYRLSAIESTSVTPRKDFWNIWSLLDNIFIYLIATIHIVTNFGHFSNFSRVEGI